MVNLWTALLAVVLVAGGSELRATVLHILACGRGLAGRRSDRSGRVDVAACGLISPYGGCLGARRRTGGVDGDSRACSRDGDSTGGLCGRAFPGLSEHRPDLPAVHAQLERAAAAAGPELFPFTLGE